MISNGIPVINLGIGSPDLQPPNKVLEVLKASLADEKAHKYQSYYGLPEFREAIAQFYRNKFQVSLSPKTEVLPLMGSKEGIMHISMAFLNKGDEASDSNDDNIAKKEEIIINKQAPENKLVENEIVKNKQNPEDKVLNKEMVAENKQLKEQEVDPLDRILADDLFEAEMSALESELFVLGGELFE